LTGVKQRTLVLLDFCGVVVVVVGVYVPNQSEGQIWVLARKSRELGALQGVRRCDVLCVWKPGMKGMKGGQLLPGSTGVSIENVIACG
jgi:hypothetical protein